MGKGLLCFPIQVFCLVEFRNRFSRIEIWLRSIQDLFVDLHARLLAASAARRGPGPRRCSRRTWLRYSKQDLVIPRRRLGGLVRPHASVPPRPCRSAGHLERAAGSRSRAAAHAADTLLLQRPAHSARRRGQARPWAPFQCFSAVLCVRKTTARAVGAAGSRSGRVSVSLRELLTSAQPPTGRSARAPLRRAASWS
jgi:hypothetical protein